MGPGKRLSLRMHWKKTLAVLLLTGLSLAAWGQQKPLRLGLGLMGAAYQGDLTTNGDAFYRFYPGVNFSLQFANQKLISPQLHSGFGRFVSQDRDIAAVEGLQPNTFVDTRFFFVEFRLKARFLREKAVHPYLAAGLGLFGYTPRDEDGSPLLDNLPTRQEGETYGTITAGFPLAVGLEWEMSHLLALKLEYAYRPTASDFLDNISALGPAAGNDKLHTFGLGLLVTFDPDRPVRQQDLRGKDRR